MNKEISTEKDYTLGHLFLTAFLMFSTLGAAFPKVGLLIVGFSFGIVAVVTYILTQKSNHPFTFVNK